MIEYFRKFHKNVPIDSKLKLPGVVYPRWEVNGIEYWSKYHAVKATIREGWEWPSFHLFEQDGFKRPQVSFMQACFNQCELISDTSRRVRHFYSGGLDSHHILECFLKTNSKLDEIVTYRRFPGSYDPLVNEYDRHNVLNRLLTLLKNYNRVIPIKIYDIMPEHFDWWSKNLEERYFPYSDIRFVAHHLQPLAEFYPELMDDNFTNIKGDASPRINLEDKSFHYIDGNFNWSFMEPFVCHFFSDSRNLDLPASMAYHLYEKQIVNKHEGRRSLGYLTDNSPLHDGMAGDIQGYLTSNRDEREWIFDMKDMRYHMNFITTELGRNSMKRFIDFYADIDEKYRKFFHGSIWSGWVCSVTKKFKLLDI